MKLAPTLYDVLEISQRASALVVKAAYRSLAQSLHPDKNLGADVAGARLAELNNAYAILSDPVKRINYDRTIGVKNVAGERRGFDADLGSKDLGHLSTGHNGSRPFAFRPLD